MSGFKTLIGVLVKYNNKKVILMDSSSIIILRVLMPKHGEIKNVHFDDNI
jgi:hypothetical protein